MQFLRRALMGVLLGALTLGALGWAGNAVWQAVSQAMNDTPLAREGREVVLAVRAVTVTPGEATPVIEAFGTLRSTRTLDLRAASAGQIVYLTDPFNDGVAVAQGQVLVRVDPAEALAARATAQADLAAAERDLRDAERSLALARDDLTVTQEQADLRAQALDRQRDLETRRVGSASAVETAALAAAQARQAVVSRRLAEAQAEAAVDQARTALDRARIALGEAERVVADTTLTAPFGGVLSEVAATRGGLVARNDLLARLVDPGALEVAFRLSTAQYARLTNGMAGADLAARPVTVSLDLDGTALTVPARDLRESPVVAEGQTGRALFARIDSPERFRPGDVVTVQIREPTLSDVARLPAGAVSAQGGVLVIGADDRLSEARVDVVRRQGDSVLVRAPDLVGARVVADQNPALGAGIKVRVIAPLAEALQSSTPDKDVPLIALTLEQRADLIAVVEAAANPPMADRDRLRALLANDRVPVQVVQQIEQRRGG